MNFLHRRIEKRQAQQGPYQDAHLILMQNSMNEAQQKADSKRGKGNLSPKKDFNLPGVSKAKSAARDKKPGSKNDGLNSLPGQVQEKE